MAVHWAVKAGSMVAQKVAHWVALADWTAGQMVSSSAETVGLTADPTAVHSAAKVGS